jgi:hypothetical protein
MILKVYGDKRVSQDKGVLMQGLASAEDTRTSARSNRPRI